jgi:hypothetical protein
LTGPSPLPACVFGGVPVLQATSAALASAMTETTRAVRETVSLRNAEPLDQSYPQ